MIDKGKYIADTTNCEICGLEVTRDNCTEVIECETQMIYYDTIEGVKEIEPSKDVPIVRESFLEVCLICPCCGKYIIESIMKIEESHFVIHEDLCKIYGVEEKKFYLNTIYFKLSEEKEMKRVLKNDEN